MARINEKRKVIILVIRNLSFLFFLSLYLFFSTLHNPSLSLVSPLHSLSSQLQSFATSSLRFLFSSLSLCHQLAPPAPSTLPLFFPFLSWHEMCSSLVCSPHRLTSVCPSHLTALLRSHLGCPPPHLPISLPANPTTTSLHMVSSSFRSSTRKRHPNPSNLPPPHFPASAPHPEQPVKQKNLKGEAQGLKEEGGAKGSVLSQA